MALVKSQHPRTWSKVHRMTTDLPTHVRAKTIENSGLAGAYNGAAVYLEIQDHEFLYDEHPQAHYDTTFGGAEITLQEIPANVVFHEMGDSMRDSMLKDAIIDAQEIEPTGPSSLPIRPWDLYGYELGVFEEPQFTVSLRNSGYLSHIDEGTTIDLVQLNMAAWNANNLFMSIRQTPGRDETEDDPVEGGVARESVKLVAPFAKFRKARLKYSTAGYTLMIRSIVVTYTEYGRKSFG